MLSLLPLSAVLPVPPMSSVMYPSCHLSLQTDCFILGAAWNAGDHLGRKEEGTVKMSCETSESGSSGVEEKGVGTS